MRAGVLVFVQPFYVLKFQHCFFTHIKISFHCTRASEISVKFHQAGDNFFKVKQVINWWMSFLLIIIIAIYQKTSLLNCMPKFRVTRPWVAAIQGNFLTLKTTVLFKCLDFFLSFGKIHIYSTVSAILSNILLYNLKTHPVVGTLTFCRINCKNNSKTGNICIFHKMC